MYDISATKEYIKYTLTLAGVGTAYVSETLSARQSFFGLTGEAVESWTRIGALATLGLFLLSTVFAIGSLNSMTNAANQLSFLKNASTRRKAINARRDPAGGVPLPASPKENDYKTNAENAEWWALELGRWHLYALLAGFLLATLYYADDIFDPKEPRGLICQSKILGATVEYECGSSPRRIFEDGEVVP